MKAELSSGSEQVTPSIQRIGQYDVLFELAHGGMGTVYLARAMGGAVGVGGFERLVAIKRLHAHLLAMPESVARFLEEAKVAARVHHANVVGVHQVGNDAGGHFLVQDYVEGDTLEGLIDHALMRRTRLPPPIVLRIAIDALSGLHAVHEATDGEGRPLGILHRDVSTQNLLVGRDGVTRLADFGIAKHAQSSVVTDAQYLQGRVLTMPPEYLDRRPVDRRFDVYGLGVTLWVALAGGSPWPDASDAQIVHLSTTKGIPPLSESGLAIAPPIEAIVARACRREPRERYSTAREMLEAIEEIGRHTGWIASHAEVAEVVERLGGIDLAARRDAIARASSRSSIEASIAEPEARVSMDRADAPPPRWKRTHVALVAGGGIALLIASAILLSRGQSHPTPPTSASVEPPRSIATEAASVPATTTVASAETAPSSDPSAPSPRTPKATGAASSPRVRTTPPSAPTGIRTDNPYR